MKSKKEKKPRNIDTVKAGGAVDALIQAPLVGDVEIKDGEEAKKKKKKRKSEVANDVLEVNGEGEATSASAGKQSKKRKRVAEEQVDVTGQEVAGKKKKKKKTVAVS